METNDLALTALFGLRCVLLVLTLGVAYAYSQRMLEFILGHGVEDRLGAAIWLFALGNAATNVNSGLVMLAMPREFHGSYWSVVFGLLVITCAHYLALTAWASFRYDIPPRRVTFHSAAFLTSVALLGAVVFAGFLWNVRSTIG